MKRKNRNYFIIFYLMFISVFVFSNYSFGERPGGLCKEIDDLSKEIDDLSKEIVEMSENAVVQRKAVEEAGKVPEPTLEKEEVVSSPVVPPEKPEKEQAKKEVEQPEELPKEAIEKKTDLDFTQAEIEDVLRIIGAGGGFNVVVDPIIKGKKVDLHIKDVTIAEALELILNAYGLDSAMVGNSLFISTKEKITRRALVNKVIKLKNIDARSAERLVKNIVETVTSDKEMNALVIRGTPSQIKEVEKIIAKVDVPQPQVLLATQILEVDTDAEKQLGIDWSDYISVTFQEGKRPASIGTAALTDTYGTPFKIYRFGRDAIEFNALIRMLVNENKAKVLSNPKVTTMNEKQAEIFIGDKIPYEVTTVTGGVASTEVRFTEAGIRLKITPSIIEEDFVVVTIEPEVSYIYSWRGTNDNYPWVRTREAAACVRVKDGEPFILGGLISEEDKKNIYKIPFFSNLPLLGKLFSYERTIYDNKEIIITVTPYIMR